MNDWTRRGVAVAGIALAALGAAYGYGRYDMGERAREVAVAIGRIGYDHGGRVPDEAYVRAEADRLAAAHGVALDGLAVARSEERGSLDAIGRLAQARMGGTPFAMDLVHFDVRTTVHAEWGPWSRDIPIEARATLRSRVELVQPPGPSGAPAGIDPLVGDPSEGAPEQGLRPRAHGPRAPRGP